MTTLFYLCNLPVLQAKSLILLRVHLWIWLVTTHSVPKIAQHTHCKRTMAAAATPNSVLAEVISQQLKSTSVDRVNPLGVGSDFSSRDDFCRNYHV